MLDRGGYVEGSQIMGGVYDYHSGAQGLLASNSNAGGTKLTTKDVWSWLPPHTAGFAAAPSEHFGERGRTTRPQLF